VGFLKHISSMDFKTSEESTQVEKTDSDCMRTFFQLGAADGMWHNVTDFINDVQ